MSFILSLIANPEIGLGAEAIARAAGAANTAGAELSDPLWLSPGEAWQAKVGGSAPDVRNAVRTALAGVPCDVNVVTGGTFRKRLLVADMDSTLIRQECIDELAAEIGVGERVATITERAMRGEIAFEPALRERVQLLAGLETRTVTKVLAERITMTPGAATLIATMRASGAHTALVSGGFTAFTKPIAERLGFDEQHANTLVTKEGRFTGEVEEPILGREAKADTLRALCNRLDLQPADTLAVGDGANDAAMVQIAGLGVAYHAKPALRELAAACVDHGDLTALLFLQGYRRDEFVSPPKP